MTKCVFCGRDESPHKGVHLLKNDGSVNFFCSSKCRKNALNLGRDRKKIKWTEAYGIAAGKAFAEVQKQEALEAGKKEEKPAELSKPNKK